MRDVDSESLEGIPSDSSFYRWLDLDGEGLPGILTELAPGGAWVYKRNESAANKDENDQLVPHFTPGETVSCKPSTSMAEVTFTDVAGEGSLDVVRCSPNDEAWGFWARTTPSSGDTASGWDNFTPFPAFPHIDSQSPRCHFMDLTGDGLADILLADEPSIFTWCPSLGISGYGEWQTVLACPDADKGPQLVLATPEESIYLADMSGDGLIDIARIRSGSVSYWPNMGYGVFGAEVTMGNSPFLESGSGFGAMPKETRVVLADIDGSGTTDLIYITGDGIANCYFNEAGNAFTNAVFLGSFPTGYDKTSMRATAVDLLGNGTSCLVWTSCLPGDSSPRMRYLDLMGGVKPHLLIGVRNGMGAETVIQYAASTSFYLKDKQAGRSWTTRLPTPVQCVESVTQYDHVAKTRLITTYCYHDGYFDGVEREFRGFAMVETRDTESFVVLSGGSWVNEDLATAVSPKVTKTWYHTGARSSLQNLSGTLHLDESRLSRLSPTSKSVSMSPQLTREAYRSFKGHVLRSEIYGADDTPHAEVPYVVEEHSFTVHILQPISPSATQHAIFLVTDRESISTRIERVDVEDPRVLQKLVLEVDAFGNPTKVATVAYGRAKGRTEPTDEAAAAQETSITMYEETSWTNWVDEDDAWLVPKPAAHTTWQVAGVVKPLAEGFHNLKLDASEDIIEELRHIGDIPTVPFGTGMSGETNAKARMLVEKRRKVYRSNDLLNLLPLGTLESLALDGQSYQLCFPADLVTEIYSGASPPAKAFIDPPASILGGISERQGGYVDLDGDGNWWVPSSRHFFHPTVSAPADIELDEARSHFFLPCRFHTAFSEGYSIVDYDVYSLRPVSTTDEVGNTTQATIDYRTLQPYVMQDPNGNRSELAFDELGHVACIAIGGKPDLVEGDALDHTTFRPFLDKQAIETFSAGPVSAASSLLDTATQRFLYDYEAAPAFSASIQREFHGQLGPGRLRLEISYMDGHGRVVQTKERVEDGTLTPDSAAVVSPRWRSLGWTVFNNKGKPVREFEPFFDDTHAFRFEHRVGVSPIIFYDPLDRIATVWFPDRTWTKTVYGAWHVELWDRSDTVNVEDPTTDTDVGPYLARLPRADIVPTWGSRLLEGLRGANGKTAALKAGYHAGTPSTAHLDVLGRSFCTVALNRTIYGDGTSPPGGVTLQQVRTTSMLDVLGNVSRLLDAKGSVVSQSRFSMVGDLVHHATAEQGERWFLVDVMRKPLYQWDSRSGQLRWVYDALRRFVGQCLTDAPGARELLVEKQEYGEKLTDGTDGRRRNTRGRPLRLFDQSGVVVTDEYDFKGNGIASSRQIAAVYDKALDHRGDGTLAQMDPDLPLFESHSEYDAVNRLRRVTGPDSTTVVYGYNDGGLVNSITAHVRGEAVATTLVSSILYNARRKRERVDYGNKVSTTYSYDPETFQLVSVTTERNRSSFPTRYLLQSLEYFYDPMGNVTCITDKSQQTIFFRNTVVEPKWEYTYDATYQLIEASGREHVGQATTNGNGGSSRPPCAAGEFHTRIDHPGDGNAVAKYLERYTYDAVGNLMALAHSGSDANHPGWTIRYEYAQPNLLDPSFMSNMLTATYIGSTREEYGYDERGNMTSMPAVRELQWDWKDQLRSSCRSQTTAAERTWYSYDSGGQRVRKVSVNQVSPSSPTSTGTMKSQTIYLSQGYEINLRYAGDGRTVSEAVETLRISDLPSSTAAPSAVIIDTRLTPSPPPLSSSPSPTPSSSVAMLLPTDQVLRYQILNTQQSSSAMELLPSAEILTYEEYFPFGATSYLATSTVNTPWCPPKRYHFLQRERDAETGLSYHGARYLVPWLARWTSADPLGLADGTNLYAYARNNPVVLGDAMGTQAVPMQKEEDGTPMLPEKPSIEHEKPPTESRFKLGGVSVFGASGGYELKGERNGFEADFRDNFQVSTTHS